MNKVDHWTKQIERMLNSGRRYKFAWGYLKSLKKEINDANRITDAQIDAIKNVQHGKLDRIKDD